MWRVTIQLGLTPQAPFGEPVLLQQPVADPEVPGDAFPVLHLLLWKLMTTFCSKVQALGVPLAPQRLLGLVLRVRRIRRGYDVIDCCAGPPFR